ncbi:hypothetical protein HBH64_162030 [Parastagonospora nodorum]|nr:hypothetical protein HBH49_185590 [Parastagonospora nodorum]KAH4182929.1 hypothetical protein HBH42_211520 [Parastagonospora nodorum]KAH4222896.1 hypothetical protein HBI06_137320 [Parastagonospora nodorum]KAH4240691.1 hypothetical protein HBI05_111420 [Parastagonospora nodorum]KAH4294181.1 hypothetical protein HBI01_166970 [Parastagonospora nodorum]
MHRLFRPEVLRAFDNLVGQLSQGPAVIGGQFKSLIPQVWRWVASVGDISLFTSDADHSRSVQWPPLLIRQHDQAYL